jgi:hypothetical protein
MARQIIPGTTDTQCGFKFFSGPLARAAALQLRTAGFAFDIELIAICQRLGAAMTEIPVHWTDAPGSTFSVPRHSAATVLDVVSIWLRHGAGGVGPSTTAAGRVAVGQGAVDWTPVPDPQALQAGVTTA